MQLKLNDRVFTSRTLNLNTVKVIGFDMDYTLVLYKELELEALAFELAQNHLINELGYPKEVSQFKFSSDKTIRGLVIDKKLGNLLKINRFGYVKAALHGDHFYSRDELRDIYFEETVSFTDHRYEMVHTMFSLASCSLFCQMVALNKVKKSYQEIYEDVIRSVDYLHRLGDLKSKIIQNPERFVILDEKYAKTLLMLKAFKKKLVLITNSEWSFTEAMMTYSFNRFLPEGKTWRDLFDLVIVDALKPEFFTQRHKFFEVIPENGFLKNVRGKIELGKIYQGGSGAQIESLFGVNKSQVLYVGDHIYADVYHSKKTNKWRTMLVITELEHELIAASQAKEGLDAIRNLMLQKEELELEVDQIKKAIVLDEESLDRRELDERDQSVRGQISEIDKKIGTLIVKYDSHFNPHWGELMWAGNDLSFFGMSIERHACLYTSKISNLLNYSPFHYFRPKIKAYSI